MCVQVVAVDIPQVQTYGAILTHDNSSSTRHGKTMDVLRVPQRLCISTGHESVHSANLLPGSILEQLDLGDRVNFPGSSSPACCTCSMRLVKKKIAIDANFCRRVLFGRCCVVSNVTGELIKGMGRPRRYSLMKP